MIDPDPALPAAPAASASAPNSNIGVSRPRIDSSEKVRGETQYTADMPPPRGLLHGRLVLGVDAHARIRRIHTAAALAVPGVVAVLTAADLPIVGGGPERMYTPLARDHVVFAGQPVAIVLAESEAAAEDGVDAVIVDTEPLPMVVDPVAAMAPGAAAARPDRAAGTEDGELESAHAAVGGAEDTLVEQVSANVSGRHWHHEGDVEAALAGSAATARGRFATSWVYQAYLEPQGATAWLEPGGTLVVQSSTQGAFYTRSKVAAIYGLPVAKVRVAPAALGGGFGAKIMVVEPLAAGAALATRRPVRIVLTRREDFAMSNPAPGSVYELHAGADADGRLTGLRARIVYDAGAFSESSLDGIGAVLVAGPYAWRRGTSARTACSPTASGRGRTGDPVDRNRPSQSSRCSTNWRRRWASTRWSCGAATWRTAENPWSTGSGGSASARQRSWMR